MLMRELERTFGGVEFHVVFIEYHEIVPKLGYMVILVS